MLSPWDALVPLVVAIVAIVAPTLLPSMTESDRGMVIYSPPESHEADWLQPRGSNDLE